MKPLLYVETTIPSYYYDERPKLANDIARTREWWDQERDAYECYVSAIVLEELAAGADPAQAECLRLIADLPVLQINEEILKVADVYRARRLMPIKPVADALHVALASWYRMDYLLT